jgi:hypothetical protein
MSHRLGIWRFGRPLPAGAWGRREPDPVRFISSRPSLQERITAAHASNAKSANQLRAWCRQKEPLYSDVRWGPLICRRSASIQRTRRDNFRHICRSDCRACKSRSRLYLASRRGEVAEWLKAMVC